MLYRDRFEKYFKTGHVYSLQGGFSITLNMIKDSSRCRVLILDLGFDVKFEC